MYRSTSPYRTPEYAYPQQAASNPPQQGQGQGQGQILPGSITYTTSTNPDGQVVYHPFKAVAASYQTPSGVVSGIQWVPAEATSVAPVGAQPASNNFADAWRGGQDGSRSITEWQRAEEKRRRKEEKEAAKIVREQNLSRGDPDSELRIARERDAAVRERRKSFNQGTSPMLGAAVPAYPTSYSGYPAAPNQPANVAPYGATGTPGYGRYAASGSMADLNQQFADMGMADREFTVERERKPSGGLARPMKYSVPETTPERTRKLSSNFGGSYPPQPAHSVPSYPPSQPSYPSSQPSYPSSQPAYPSSQPTYSSSQPSYSSSQSSYSSSQPSYTPSQPTHSVPSYPPAPGEAGFLPSYPPAPGFSRSASPMPYGGNPNVYPPGHILEGAPKPPHSRATTPLPQAGSLPGSHTPSMGGAIPFPTASVPFSQPSVGPSPRIPEQGAQQLAAPPCFSRPVNAAQSYVSFATMKIQDMDDFLEKMARMPAVLKPHDVYVEDWNRLMQDIFLAWSGRLPVPNLTDSNRPPKRATLLADLIDLWNASFFIRRGVEIVLYKGRERRSGSNAGVVDLPSHLLQDSQNSSSSDEDSDSDDDMEPGAYGYYPPSVPGQGSMAEVLELRRRRNEIRAEKKRRRRERKMRQKERARERKYALYLTCVRPGQSGVPYPPYSR